MFLKSLQIIGFKSFAEKTHLEFNNGITALVGPNGGGKSNIVDAIRWALGEQSARILRADKMEDLIFNGNEDRPRSNFAEVEITLVNENSILPVEYNEISITRRLYRSGESEYLLNKNPVKLKDINVLFMDTGVGKAAYSIIGQGKIDQMISEKPEERRIIFDEAASITKYRARIREYESKLADTREHLTRIDISLKEKEKQYNLLKNQAERTNLYFAISETMKNAEIDYDLYKIQKFKNEKEKVDSRLVQLTRDIDSLSEDVNKIAEEINSITGIIKSREYDATQMEKNTITLEGKISTATNRLLIFRENINDIGQNIVISENRSRETAARLERFQAEIMRLEKEITENTGKIENFLAQNQALILKKTGLETEIEKLREEIHNRKRRNFEIDNMRSSLEEKHKIIINELIQELDNLKNAVSSQKAAGDEERQKLGIMGGRLKELSGFLKNIDFSALSGTDFSARKDEITSLLAEFCTASESFIDLSSGIIGKKDPFQELVFSAEGAYAKKEEIDASLLSLDAEKTQNAENIDSMEKLVRTHQKSIEDHNAEAGRNEVQMAALNENLRISDKTRTEHLKEAEACREEIAKIDSGLKDLAARRQELENKIIEEGKILESYQKNKSEININIKDYLEHIRVETARLGALQEKLRSRQEKLQHMQKQHEEFNTKSALHNNDLKNIYDNAYEKYSVDLRTRDIINKEFDPEKLQNTMQNSREEIKKLGVINPLAVDEYNEIKTQYEEIKNQKEDILAARKDLEKITEEINRTSRALFTENFEKINKNFHRIFRRLLNGGTARLELEENKDVLEAGIEIMVQPPGKKVQHLSLLSGGEKAVSAIALMFAIFMVKASPFCLLDEIDAPLDEENISRIMEQLKEFSANTQFIIITHSRTTIKYVDVMYGFTPESGISRMASLRLNDPNLTRYLQKTG